jgi:hypothetical protein
MKLFKKELSEGERAIRLLLSLLEIYTYTITVHTTPVGLVVVPKREAKRLKLGILSTFERTLFILSEDATWKRWLLIALSKLCTYNL